MQTSLEKSSSLYGHLLKIRLSCLQGYLNYWCEFLDADKEHNSEEYAHFYIIAAAPKDNNWKDVRVLAAAVLLNHLLRRGDKEVLEFATVHRWSIYKTGPVKQMIADAVVPDVINTQKSLPLDVWDGASFNDIIPLLFSVPGFSEVYWELNTDICLSLKTLKVGSCLFSIMAALIGNTRKAFSLMKVSLQCREEDVTVTHANYLLFDRELTRWIWFEPHGVLEPTHAYQSKVKKLVGEILYIPQQYCTLPGPQMVINAGYCTLFGLMQVERYISLPKESRLSMAGYGEALLNQETLYSNLVSYLSIMNQ